MSCDPPAKVERRDVFVGPGKDRLAVPADARRPIIFAQGGRSHGNSPRERFVTRAFFAGRWASNVSARWRWRKADRVWMAFHAAAWAAISGAGRRELAEPALRRGASVRLVATRDEPTALDPTKGALARFASGARLPVVAEAGHLFRQPAALARAADLAGHRSDAHRGAAP